MEFRDSRDELPGLVGRSPIIYQRLLDRFYVPLPPDPIVSTALFDLEARDYDNLVRKAQNVSNITTLLNLVLAALPMVSEVNLLDFGCGTGLSLAALNGVDAKASREIEVVGTDCSLEMLKIATEKGLRTIPFDHWWKLPDECFDGIIASYVFHCGLRSDELAAMARQLRRHGVLVGNYHHATEKAISELCRKALTHNLALVTSHEDLARARTNPVLVFCKAH